MIKKIFEKIVDRFVCDWDEGDLSALPSCKRSMSHKVVYYKDMKYCPFCGKRIRLTFDCQTYKYEGRRQK